MSQEDRPVSVVGLVGATALSLALALRFPLWLAVVGFVLFGVAHNLAELRYVLARYAARLDRGLFLQIAAPLLGVIAARAGTGWLWSSPVGRQIELTLVYGTLLGVAALHRGPFALRAGLIGLISLGAWASFTWTGLHFLVLSHLHNLMPALFVLLHYSKDRARVAAATLLWAAVVPALILSGALDGLLNQEGLGPLGSLSQPRRLYGLWVPPGWEGAEIVRVVATFSFLQGMHYAIWIGLLPAASGTPAPAGRGWRWFYGPVGTAAAVIVTLALVPGYAISYLDTFSLYGALASFHALVEFPLLLAFLLDRRAPAAPVVATA